MEGHFAAWYEGDNQIGGCLQWNVHSGKYHTSKWYLFKPVDKFIAVFYCIEDEKVKELKRCNVELICSHKVLPGLWSRGSITLEETG